MDALLSAALLFALAAPVGLAAAWLVFKGPSARAGSFGPQPGLGWPRRVQEEDPPSWNLGALGRTAHGGAQRGGGGAAGRGSVAGGDGGPLAGIFPAISRWSGRTASRKRSRSSGSGTIVMRAARRRRVPRRRAPRQSNESSSSWAAAPLVAGSAANAEARARASCRSGGDLPLVRAPGAARVAAGGACATGSTQVSPRRARRRR